MEFDKLCESMGILKRTTRERYPREIKLSEEFLEALKKEYYNHKLEEDSSKPVRNRPEKFAKALRFHITHLENTSAVELEAMRQRYADEVGSDTKVAVEGCSGTHKRLKLRKRSVKEGTEERVPEVSVSGKKMELPQNKTVGQQKYPQAVGKSIHKNKKNGAPEKEAKKVLCRNLTPMPPEEKWAKDTYSES